MNKHFQEQLAGFIKHIQPDLIIETGVQTGVSSRDILQALDDNGKGSLISIDPYNRHNLSHPRWRFCEGFSFDWLPRIYAESPGWDIFFHDSDHAVGCQTFEYEFAWRCLNPGGYLLTDDFNWNQDHKVWDRFLEKHEVPETISLGAVRGCQKPLESEKLTDIETAVSECSVMANSACDQAGLPQYLPTRLYDENYLLNVG